MIENQNSNKISSKKSFSKKNILWISSILLVVGVLISIGTCSGHQHRKYHHAPIEKRAEWISKKITKKLELDDNQKKVLDKIKNEIVQKSREMRGTRKLIFKELLSQVKEDELDKEKLNKLINSQQKKIKKFRIFLIDKAHEFHKVLKPEQKQKLYNFLEKKLNRHSKK